MAMKRRPWRMLAPLAVVLVLAILWSIYWAVASSKLKDAYAEAERNLAGQGVSLACGAADWGGYPFRIERDCNSPRLAFNSPWGPVDISAQRLIMAVQAYNPRHAVALLDGATTFRGPAIEEISHARALASLKFASDDDWEVSVELPRIAVPELGSANLLVAHARVTPSGSADLALSAEKLDIAIGRGVKLAIDAADLTASLPKEALAPDIARYLASSGKEITIANVAARQGGLAITGSGTVMVDSSGYVSGRIPLRINRIDLLFEIVKQVADLSDDDAAAARTFIELLPKGEGASAPQIALIAKDRKLYWGPFKLTDLQPLF
jgi:hypothetical protein